MSLRSRWSREGSRLAFGEYVNTVYHLDEADVIVSLDADFLSAGPGACVTRTTSLISGGSPTPNPP